MVPVSGFLCRLCKKFFYSEATARHTHCRTHTHFVNVQVNTRISASECWRSDEPPQAATTSTLWVSALSRLTLVNQVALTSAGRDISVNVLFFRTTRCLRWDHVTMMTAALLPPDLLPQCTRASGWSDQCVIADTWWLFAEQQTRALCLKPEMIHVFQSDASCLAACWEVLTTEWNFNTRGVKSKDFWMESGVKTEYEH